jgi:phosphatidate cytidylyltransferase
VTRVVTAVVLILVVVVALFKAPFWLFTLLVLAVALLAAREYLDLARATGFEPCRRACYVLLLCLFFVVGIQVSPDSHYPQNFLIAIFVARTVGLLLIFASPFLFMVLTMRRQSLAHTLPDASVSLLLLPYIGGSLICLPLMNSYSNGAMYILFLMLIVWTGDIAALYVGRAIGTHKLAPRVSPGKTWEGAIASGVAAVIVALLLFRFAQPISYGLTRIHLLAPAATSVLYPQNLGTQPVLQRAPFWLVILFALSVNIAAQFGDLVESALKRGADVKDSGTLLPGHGGMLDRIDALLFAAPVGQLFLVSGMLRYFQARGILS